MEDELKFLAVKIGYDKSGVKFGSYNSEFLCFFGGEKAHFYAEQYARLQNKLHGIKEK